MYQLFREVPLHKLGAVRDVGLPYIRRIYEGLIRDVKTYYRKRPKFVESNNLLVELIKQFVVEFKSDDFAYARKVEQQLSRLVGVMGLTSPINKGKVWEGGVTLGPKSNEVVMVSFEDFPTQGLEKTWQELKPLRYLYHTRTDIGLPIMNNTTPGIAYGVILINIPMLLVQYRYWLKDQIAIRGNEVESPMRFVGAYVLPNAIESFLDISWFNRLERQAKGIPNPRFPAPHPFYITDMSDRLEKLAKFTNEMAVTKAITLEATATAVPSLVNPTLFETVKLPKGVVTVQNEWAIALARFPYIRYLTSLMQNGGVFDRAQLNDVIIDLIETTYDSTFSQFGNNAFVKSFKQQVIEFVAKNK